ncbi:MAG: hypothetical protein H6711_18260 [Myxococcales bacterium]|nr:hypothetical protein [Myxococcales bacterium]
MEVSDSSYRVWYDPTNSTVYFEGSLRLGTADYEPITRLLHDVLAGNPPHLTLHMLELVFLNSSGINTLYKFAIALRKQGKTAVSVRGAASIPWQTKSLANLKKFLPTIEIDVQ